MKQQNERFAPKNLDEQLEQRMKKQERGTPTPEQQLLWALQSLHATRAEHEQQLLERVRLRLVLSKEGDRKRTEEEETFLEPVPSSEGNPPLLPTFRRRKHLSVFLQSLAAVLLVGLLVGSFLTALRLSRPGTTPASNLARNWHVTSGPHLPSSQNHLWGVSASAENDVWAVGESFDGSHRKTLIEHWNGRQWSVVATPNPGVDPTLEGVVAISPENAWAVGTTSAAQGRDKTIALVEHWNGKQWSIVQAPNPGSNGSGFSKVIAIAENDVWAIGYTVDAGMSKTLIEHWDGKQWHLVVSPSLTSVPTFLLGITAISARDIWTVGYSMPSQSTRRAFIEHWDGKTWSIVEVPGLKSVNSQLFGVSAISSNDVWAVGTLENGLAKPLVEHWDGSRWSASPIPDELENSLSNVLAITPYDVWAVGATSAKIGQQALLVHWDGRQWSTVQTASASSQCQNQLIDLAAVPQSGRLWSVGNYATCNSASLIQPLFEIYTP